MCCSALQRAVNCNAMYLSSHGARRGAHRNYLNTLQLTATHCNSLQLTASHCNTLQHTATHCNTQTATQPVGERQPPKPQQALDQSSSGSSFFPHSTPTQIQAHVQKNSNAFFVMTLQDQRSSELSSCPHSTPTQSKSILYISLSMPHQNHWSYRSTLFAHSTSTNIQRYRHVFFFPLNKP